MFIVDNDLGEAGVEKVLEQVQQEIRDAGCEIASVDLMGKRTLTHPIRKRAHGYYAVVEFEGDGSVVDPLLARYRLTEGLLRAHIVRARPAEPSTPAEEPAAATEAEEAGDDGVAE